MLDKYFDRTSEWVIEPRTKAKFDLTSELFDRYMDDLRERYKLSMTKESSACGLLRKTVTYSMLND